MLNKKNLPKTNQVNRFFSNKIFFYCLERYLKYAVVVVFFNLKQKSDQYKKTKQKNDTYETQPSSTDSDRLNKLNQKKDNDEPDPQFSLRPASTKTSSSKPTSRPSSPVSFPKITNKSISPTKESVEIKQNDETQSKNITNGRVKV